MTPSRFFADAAPAPPPVSVPGAARPRVRATRSHIDDRFASLSLIVQTGEKPYFEIQLASDPSLFEPGAEDRRTEKNFFSSRRSGGLLRSEDEQGQNQALYVVPGAALKALSAAGNIFYCAIAYDDESGAGALRSHPDPRQAPYVKVAKDFTGHTLGRMLSVPLESLRRVRPGEPAEPYRAEQLMTPNGHNGYDDGGEGEDGGDYAMGLEDVNAGPVEDEYDDIDAEPMAADYDQDHYVEHEHAAEAGAEFGPGDSYDDGFGALEDATDYADDEEDEDHYSASQSDGDYGIDDDEDDEPATAMGGDYPAGATAPEMLEDEDSYEDEVTPEDYQASGDAAGYGDEADDYDDEPDFEPLDAPRADAAAAQRQLSIDAQKAILKAVAQIESGEDFSAVKANEGYASEGHPAYQSYLTGVDYGYLGFNQDRGELGKLLEEQRKNDSATFDRIFGAKAGQLVDALTAAGASSKDSPGGRSARVQPIDGKDLWEEPWVSRLREAGMHTPFQATQLKAGAALFLTPMLSLARSLSLNSDRALALLVDRAVDMGVGEAQQWVVGAVNPAQTPAQRQQALGALGYDDVASFQQDAGLMADGAWNAPTQAALFEALAEEPAASPVPVPTLNDKLDALARAAEREPFAARVATLRNSDVFQDVVYQL